MTEKIHADITETIKRLSAGDVSAQDHLFNLLYQELKPIARARLRSSGSHTLLDTTSLVHESYLRLVSAEVFEVRSRKHFFAYASKAMRSVIIDLIRENNADRRGGGQVHVELDTNAADNIPAEFSAEAVHDALKDLEKLDMRLAEVVELRFFGGLTETEIAMIVDRNERTVREDWRKARAILVAYLTPE
jgi:RNA polymerase sigma factor (TIGR02999 family)